MMIQPTNAGMSRGELIELIDDAMTLHATAREQQAWCDRQLSEWRVDDLLVEVMNKRQDLLEAIRLGNLAYEDFSVRLEESIVDIISRIV